MGSISGTPVNPETGKALNPKNQSLLDSQDSSDEYEGMSPLAMGLLQAGASMMRNSGWRNTPMTTGEAIGHAIPAGITGYYNQDMMNQQGEAEFYERQQAEEQARQAEEQARVQQKQEQAQINSAIDQLDLIDTKIINREAKRALKVQLSRGGASFKGAMEEIIRLTSVPKAGEVRKHELTGTYGYEDKEGNWIPVDVPEKTVSGTPMGTFQIGSQQANNVLGLQGITDTPEGTKYILAKPIGIGGVNYGASISFLDDSNTQITSEEDKEAQAKIGTRYLDPKSKAFKGIHPNLDLNLGEDDLVGLDEHDTIIGYKLKDMTVKGGYLWLAEGNKLLQQAKLKQDLTKVITVNRKGFNSTDGRFKDYFDGKTGLPKINIPDATANVKILPDGNIQFLDKDDQPVSASPTITLARMMGNGDVHTFLINKNTGVDIKDLGLANKYREPLAREIFNLEQAEKAQKHKSIDALIKDLQTDFGFPPSALENLKARSLVDVDKALDEISGYYDAEYAKSDAIKTGYELNESGVRGEYANDIYYKRDGDTWTQYRPEDSKTINSESALRKEYNQLTRDYRVAGRGYDGVIKGLEAENGHGDIMAITSFRIMFEPNSVVREAEFEITAKAGGFIEDMLRRGKTFFEGDKLSTKTRNKMRVLVDQYMTFIKRRADKDYKTYTSIAKARKYNMDSVGIDHAFKTYPSLMGDTSSGSTAGGTPDQASYDADFGVTEGNNPPDEL